MLGLTRTDDPGRSLVHDNLARTRRRAKTFLAEYETMRALSPARATGQADKMARENPKPMPEARSNIEIYEYA